MFRFVVLSFAVFGLVQGSTVPDTSNLCTFNPGPLPINTYIEGCPTPPCALPQSQDAVFHFEFVIPGSEPVQNMRTHAVAIWRGVMQAVHIPYNLRENSVTCDFLTNASCPVQGGQLLKHTVRVPIKGTFNVGTQFSIEFRVIDENNHEVLMCLRVPVQMVEG